MDQPVSKKQRKASRFFNEYLKRGIGASYFKGAAKQHGKKVTFGNGAGKQNLFNNLAQIQLPQKKG